MENGLSLGEAMALTNKDDGFGNGSWFMWIIALAIIFGNGGGFGFGGNNRGVEGIATRDAVNSGFQYNQLDNGIRGLQSGLCDGFYALNNSVKDGAYALDSSIKNCCCETNRNIDSVRYDMSKGFCDVITASNAGVQKILDVLCANEKQALRDKIQTLETSSIVQAQTKNLVEALRPIPVPAYITCSPYAAAPNNCGCGCAF
jgi:hypothetical protein